jgi:hypothetical protein
LRTIRLEATSVSDAFQPVADLDAHLAVLRNDDYEHAVI